jgi:uncharacterized damage-inducible protein DinB
MRLTTKAAVTTLSLAVAVLAGSRAPALAQGPGAGGVKGEMLFWIEDAEKKLVELADATPEAKYKWRPAKDARSTGEVFMHVVTANYGIPSIAGVKPPEGFNFETYEKSLTKKADIDKALKDSFAHAKKALTDATEADLNKPIEMFGMKTTFRGAYMLVLAHAHEHLGQSIAYARSNKIAPPWTERNKARFEAARKAAAEKAAAAK